MIAIENEHFAQNMTANVDLCFFTISDNGKVPLQQANEIIRSMLFLNITYRHFVFECKKCKKGYNYLPERTYAFLQTLSNSKCRAAIKVDVDGMFCGNNVKEFYSENISNFKLRKLPFLYGGYMSLMNRLPRSKKFKRAMESAKFYSQIKTSGITKMPWFFSRGPAYIIGVEVAKFIVNQPFHSLVNTGLEDVNVGIHSNAFRQRIQLPLKATDRFCQSKNLAVYHHCSGSNFKNLCNVSSLRHDL